jgi:hypothetical protein
LLNDLDACEEYIDEAKRGILKATTEIERKESAATSGAPLNQHVTPISRPINLPPLKILPFSGDIETWPRFWEQFSSSVDQNNLVPTIDKHVLLRGYLEGEPRYLVEGIAVIAENYAETKRILQQRYGDKNRIIQAHLDFLDDVKPVRSPTPEALNSTFIECNRRIQALQALGEDVGKYGRILAPKILRAFPDDICRRWIIHAKRGNLQEGDILKLMSFLSEEVEGVLTTQKIRGEFLNSTDFTATTAAFHIHARQTKLHRKAKKEPDPFCVFCENRGHWAQDCTILVDVNRRLEKLKNANRCYLCLNRGHLVRDCPKKNKAYCSRCKKAHHRSICNEGEDNRTPVPPCNQPKHLTVGKIDVTLPDYTYLQTACVWVQGPRGNPRLTRCILDAGSQSSFIHKSLVDDLNLDVIGQKDLVISTFESKSCIPLSRRLVRFDITGFSLPARVSITAYESDSTYSPHPTVPRDIDTFAANRNFILADPKKDGTDLDIELLIGADQYWQIVLPEEPRCISTSLAMIPSRFGWILSGGRSGVTVRDTSVHHVSLGIQSTSDEAARHLWDLETIGIRETQGRVLSSTDAAILSQFHDTYHLQEGRRVVSLPRKVNVRFSNNRQTSENRFHALVRKLQTSDTFKSMYYDLMLDYIRKGQVELAPTPEAQENVYYLPHHAVKKQQGSIIKWRIVFDASSHEYGSPSLNEALEMGPNLLPEILAVLLRFRLQRYAIVCDIHQAFLQLSLHADDRDLTSFLWYRVERDKTGSYRTLDDVTCYRFKRLPFGLTSSPFLLSATLRELASLHSKDYPTAAPLLDRNTYMDDLVFGADDDNQAVTIYYELTGLLRLIKLPLSKWGTNCGTLRSIWAAEGSETRCCTSVLGIHWDSTSDHLYFPLPEIVDHLADEVVTKRLVLRMTAKLFDPLGFFTPVWILGKIIFQDTWFRRLGWDEILPVDLARRWHSWTSKLPSLRSSLIPRWLGISLATKDWAIHVFCDASERAYGAVLYVCSSSSTTRTVQLVLSKSRLAPIKKVQLPRLELLAALLGARLLRYFTTEAGLDTTIATLWSDSTVTLGWIRSDPNRWKPFVQNRVTEIQTSTTPSQWRHCPGTENPADLLSRGLQADELGSTPMWWQGPKWLLQSSSSWPKETTTTDSQLPEERKIAQILTITIRQPLLDIARFGNYWKLLNVTGWIFRFLQMLRDKGKGGGALTAEELQRAKRYWIRQTQEEYFPEELAALRQGLPLPTSSAIVRFNPYVEDDLLRLGGRLQFADISEGERHPILLHGSHPFTHLLIQQTHVRLHHLGVRIVLEDLRRQFWIIRGRQEIKKTLRSCLPCKIVHGKPSGEIEAPLPSDRVRPSRPFSVTGIDFAGPLYVRSGKTLQKSYIVLFTCATTRAIHLELASDMTAEKFVMALKRFAGRRGLPHTIYSDNARTFHAVNKELVELFATLNDQRTLKFLAQEGITWKFIAPRAAWWGGWWERMVGTTKRCLRKVLGRLQASEEELNTVLVGIEAALNSRPITQDRNTLDVLTPAHFTSGGILTDIPRGPEPRTGSDLTRTLRIREQWMDHFWKRWRNEYLLQLRSYHEVRRPGKDCPVLKTGDIVLLQEDMKPRMSWKRARVQELHQGRDGRTRSATLHLPDGSKICRPIQLVIPLEINQGGEDVAA